MKKFTEYKNLNLVEIAESIAKFWSNDDTFRKSVKNRQGSPEYVFYEGPPSANGMPGIHHVMARSIKDIFCRFQTQNGKQVLRKAGWDTHGLPVELGVEKELGITKEDIGKRISVEEYNRACRDAVMRYTDVWNNLTSKIGYWVDLDDPYITYEPKYMESVWWLIKQLYDKGLLYKGYTVQPYSPAAGTGLSSHELNQPGTYRDVSDTSVVAQFKVNRQSSDLFQDVDSDVYILAWTTTPWTLPSNTSLVVGEDISYVLVKTFNQYTFEPINVVLAKELLHKNFGNKYVESSEEEILDFTPQNKNIPYKILKEFSGKELAGTRYEQLIPWFTPFGNLNGEAGVLSSNEEYNSDNAFCVVIGDFVTTQDGTGIVHSAPTFGVDDARVAKENNIPPMLVRDENDNLVPLVDLQGRFVEGKNVPETLSGKYIKNDYYESGKAPERSWDVELAILLKTENKAFKVEKYSHSYPHCWRTDKPVLYYPLDSWFVKMTKVRDRLVELNKNINWKPKHTGEGRFANWLENVNDWNLSRSRYWGIPLPIWRTEDLKEEKVIGSLDELVHEIKKSIDLGFMSHNPYEGFEAGNMDEDNYSKVDLHKNIVDEIILVSDSGKAMKRESDLIDVWFDSGAMPYAQLHYPFENKDLIDSRKFFPADFIAEGVDQTRGWFYTLHAISTTVFDSISYKNVVSNGLVLDKNGQKMSKRLGNAIDPFETLDAYGPDATRWYMVSNAMPWENLKFDLDGVDEVRRKFFGTLYNTYSFFALYANVDKFKYKEKNIENPPEIDRWIISELNILVKDVKSFYEDYEPTKVARAINAFVNDNLSNWYVRLCRRRFWKGEYSEDKISAYQTLYTCLETVAKISAPIAPFFMDRLYLDLNETTGKNPQTSVHLTDFPIADESKIDLSLVEKTSLAQKITSMVFSLRKKESIKVRQPLQKIMIPVLDSKTKRYVQDVSELVKQEVNVKEIQIINADESSELIVKQIKPNYKNLGPKLGKDMKTVAQKICEFSNDEILILERGESINVNNYDISLEDVEISTKDIPGWTIASEGNISVALDINITEELKAEGIAREFINRVQNIRKDKKFEINDRIIIELEQNNKFLDAIMKNKDYIGAEVLSQDIIAKNNIFGDELEMEGYKFIINIIKI